MISSTWKIDLDLEAVQAIIGFIFASIYYKKSMAFLSPYLDGLNLTSPQWKNRVCTYFVLDGVQPKMSPLVLFSGIYWKYLFYVEIVPIRDIELICIFWTVSFLLRWIEDMPK